MVQCLLVVLPCANPCDLPISPCTYPQDRADAADNYNDAVVTSGIVGIISSIFLYWLGLGSPWQFIIGLTLALTTLWVPPPPSSVCSRSFPNTPKV
jgi:hypothetical protein